MKPTPLSLPLKAGGFLGFLATAIIGWNLAETPPVSAAAPAADSPATRHADRPARHSRSTGPASLAGKRLEPIRNAGTPSARMSATVDLANSLPPSEFAAWLDGGYFTLRDGPELTLFTKILQERWKKEDPEGLLAWSLKNGSGQGGTVLADWAAKDPQRLIEFFKNHPDDQAEMRSLQTMAAANPALALQRLQEMAASGLSQQGMAYSSSLLAKLAEKSPAALEAVLASLPPQMKQQAESALSGERLKTSFSTEIRALWDRPDGWKIFENNIQRNDGMGGKIFDELANIPPAWRAQMASNAYYFIDNTNPQKWLDADLAGYGFSDSQAKSIRESAFSKMGYRQPELAIKRLDEFTSTPEARQSAISNIMSYASGDPEKTAALIALLGTDEDRKIAQSVVDGRNRDSSETKVEKPADWLNQVGSLDPKTGSPYSYFRMLEQWDAGKIAELNAGFKTLPADKKLVVARALVSGMDYGNSNSTLTGDAVRYLVANPASDSENQGSSIADPIRASSSYAVHLATKDPVAASEWVQTLPAGDAKLWAQKNLATNWMQYDPKAVDQWVKSLPAADRAEVTKHLQKKQ